MTPFVVLALPRSRTAWLSHFLTYGPWVCGHEELRHMRSLEDAKSYLSMPFTGSAETALAPYWRTLLKLRPDIRVVVIRRDVEAPVQSFLKVPGTQWDEAALRKQMIRLDHKLDQIARRMPNVLSVPFEDLTKEEACARIFEFCLGMKHDAPRWQQLDKMNIQCHMPQLIRHCTAHMPQLIRFASQVKQDTLRDMEMAHQLPSPDSLTFSIERFTKENCLDCKRLIQQHCADTDRDPEQGGLDFDLHEQMSDEGTLFVTIARSNGRPFGYLVTMVGRDMERVDQLMAEHKSFYAHPAFPGVGRQLRKRAAEELRERGVGRLLTRAGTHGDGPRLRKIYERMGGASLGEVFVHNL